MFAEYSTDERWLHSCGSDFYVTVAEKNVLINAQQTAFLLIAL